MKKATLGRLALIEQCLAQDPRPAYQVPAPQRVLEVLLA